MSRAWKNPPEDLLLSEPRVIEDCGACGMGQMGKVQGNSRGDKGSAVCSGGI